MSFDEHWGQLLLELTGSDPNSDPVPSVAALEIPQAFAAGPGPAFNVLRYESFLHHRSPPLSGVTAPPDSPSGPRAPAQTPNDAAVSILGNMSGRAAKDHLQSSSNNFLLQGSPGQAGEFNHAIQYLKKIRMRYADDQATYKTFLEILQAYQKEQRHSHDVRLAFVVVSV